MKGEEIRQNFLDFFAQRKHYLSPSSGLVPTTDNTLLFTSAGMVQFKNMFLGKTKLEYRRAASCQKCFRTNDIERVGHTARHHTFFEMLGNFSFGDYFKKEAIQWAWEFLVNQMHLDEQNLWVSVYEEDDESFNIWKTIIKEKRIVRLGKESNFWEMGATGPCGPCSEIIFDQGEKFSCGKSTCKVGCDCDRYLEVWNLVFTQFDRDINGELNPLPQKNIDTGMGLERLAAVVQKANSNFDTDLFKPIIKYTGDLAGVEYNREEKIDIALKIIADHIRAICFLTSEGILPSNEGRGYVLRRVIRRALRQGKILNIQEPFLHQVASKVIESMSKFYPELKEARERIYQVILMEEKRFQETLDQGLEILAKVMDELQQKGEKQIPASEVFRLYDTYGFPPDITKEIAQENNFSLDLAGFDSLMEEQKEKARDRWQGSGAQDITFYTQLQKELGDTKFVGYENKKNIAKVLALIYQGKLVNEVNTGQEIEIILDQTSFYGETGGQVGDTGKIVRSEKLKVKSLQDIDLNQEEFEVEVEIIDTKRPLENFIIHIGKVKKGIIKKQDEVLASIDIARRNNIARNHTATHLLQAALRKHLGAHVTQSGSLVSGDYLRFDFTHFQGLDKNQLHIIEDEVNAKIRENLPVLTKELPLEEARTLGAMALFGEKYGKTVRTILITPADLNLPKKATSIELCGGTHCHATGEIGLFKIISESSIAQGVRRIEALTGEKASEFVRKQEETVAEISQLLRATADETLTKIQKLLEDNKKLQKELNKQKTTLSSTNFDQLLEKTISIDGIKVISSKIEDADHETLRKIGDFIKNKLKTGVILLGSIKEAKIALICMVTKDLTSQKGLDAAKIVKEVSMIVEGTGGGRSDLAQGGGKNLNKLDDAISKSLDIISKMIKT